MKRGLHAQFVKLWDGMTFIIGCGCLSEEVKVELNKEVSDNKDGDLCWYSTVTRGCIEEDLENLAFKEGQEKTFGKIFIEFEERVG